MGYKLALTNVAADAQSPPQTLTFSLETGSPDGASLDAASGQFAWTPTPSQAPTVGGLPRWASRPNLGERLALLVIVAMLTNWVYNAATGAIWSP